MPGPQRQPTPSDDYLVGLFGSGPAAGTPVVDTKWVGNDTGRGFGGRGGGRGGVQAAVNTVLPVQKLFVEEDVAKILRGMPPERIAQIQRRLQTVGLLPENFKSFGFVENTTRSGFTELLDVANGRGESNWDNTLDVLVAGTETTLGEERVKAASRRQQAMLAFDTRLNTYEKSDPASVRQTAEQAFQQALGRKPKKAELERFVNGFLSRERGEQSKVFGIQDSFARGQRDRTLASIDLDERAAEAAAGGASGGGGSESDELWTRLQTMVKDSPYKIGLGSRSRSYEEQVRLYNNWKAGKGPRAAKPGTSKHGDGRANDLKYSSDKARQWVLENAHRYGLHLPLYDPKLPRDVDESWHVELKGGHSTGDGHNHGAAAGAAAGAAVAPVSQDVTVQRQDLGAQAIEYARNVNPNETQAYDIGGQFQNLLAILQKGVI